MRLAVELHGTLIGTLDGDSRTFDFAASEAGIERFGVNSVALSVTVPLVPGQRPDQAGRRRNWFRELLPEGAQYDCLLSRGGLVPGDTLAFLARYGRDVAGALQVWDLDDPTEPRVPSCRELSASDIRKLMEDPVGYPLGNDADSGKSSLSGVQPKIVLARTSSGWAQALGGFPSTHILKPCLEGRQATVIFDEEYGSRIARRMGLSSFATWVEEFDGLPAIVIERYDRHQGERVHQEDFNQVLGASGNQKYQEYGGVVSFRRVAAAVRKHCPEAELRRLARLLVVAVGVGNLDLHTKNLSLVHPLDGEVALAPAYDVVPQAHMPNDQKLALAVNKKYRHSDLARADLEAELSAWGLRRTSELVDEALLELREVVGEETPLPGAFSGLQADIGGFVDNLCRGRAVGVSHSR